MTAAFVLVFRVMTLQSGILLPSLGGIYCIQFQGRTARTPGIQCISASYPTQLSLMICFVQVHCRSVKCEKQVTEVIHTHTFVFCALAAMIKHLFIALDTSVS